MRQDDPRFQAHLHGDVAASGGRGSVMINRVSQAVARCIWITITDFRLWGCPYCGYCIGINAAIEDGETSCDCWECGKGFVVVGDQTKRSYHNWGTDTVPLYPKVRRQHPRYGTPCHGNPNDSRYHSSPRGFKLVGGEPVADTPLITVEELTDGEEAALFQALGGDDDHEWDERMVMPIRDIPGLGAKEFKVLCERKIVIYHDLTQHPRSQFLKFHGIGEKTVTRLEAALAEVGLAFKPENEPL